MKVLVAYKDSKERVELLHSELRRMFDKVLFSSGGMNTLDIVSGDDIDIVIVDAEISDISVGEVVFEIKKRRPSCEVIVLSSLEIDENVIKSLRYGAVDYIETPVVTEQLYTALGRAVERIREKGKAAQSDVILIIDDEKLTLKKLSRLFNREDYEVFTAESGAEGLRIIKEKKVDVIITDIKMDDMDGIEVLKRAKELYDDIAGIMVTGFRDDELAVQSLRAGAADYITKPINLDQLLLSVKKALDGLQLNRNRLFRARELKISSEIISAMNEELEERIKERSVEISKVQALNNILKISMEPISLSAQLQRILDVIFSVSWLSLESKGSIFLVDDEPDVLVMKSHRGLSDQVLSLCNRVKFGVCLCGKAAEKSDILFAECIDNRHDIVFEGMQPHGHYCVPIISKSTLLGVINLYVKEGHKRDPGEEAFLSSVSSTLAGIIERRKMEETLKDLEQKNELILNTAGEGIYGIDLNGFTTFVNTTAADMMGWKVEELVGMHRHDVFHHTAQDSEFCSADECPICRSFTYDEMFQQDNEVFFKKDGTGFPAEYISTPMRDGKGSLIGSVVVFKDITERKQMEQRLKELAHFDTLTGLANRMLMYDRLKQALATAMRSKAKLALLFIDLDRFKNVNDTLGHNIGDLLLKEVALRFEKIVRKSDTVARMGGDEFTIILTTIDSGEDAAIVAQKVISSLTLPFNLNSKECSVGASIGISIFPSDGDNADRLIKNADTAMYQAKYATGNTYKFYSPDMDTLVFKRLTMENELRNSIEHEDFLLYFQPIVDLASGRVVSVESLLRWKRRGVELVPPDEFIPIAEETGLILQIGQWVLQNACKQNKLWQKEGIPPLVVTINMSMCQFLRQDNLMEIVAQTLFETELAPEFLELELTESICMQNIEATISTLREFNKMGVKLSIDDFGTGYSSLSYLKHLPIDKLKVDMSFIKEVMTEPNDASIVKAIVAMAHTLGLRVIAEGVETREQMEFLQSIKCDEAQGFFFGRPSPANEAGKLLREMDGKSLVEVVRSSSLLFRF